VADPDLDLLARDDDLAAAADAALDPDRFGRGVGAGSGGACVADACDVGACERVGQRAQQGVPVDQVQHRTVDADGQAASGQVVANRVLGGRPATAGRSR
jgi:hypothetical protein